MSLATETRRFSRKIGASFLTHGSDDYAHNHLNKCRRRLDKALVTEQQEDVSVASRLPKVSETFRIVVHTQEMENYNWEDEGLPYWKYKGGTEYHLATGLTAAQVVALGKKGLEAIVESARDQMETDGEYFRSWVINWELVSSFEQTCDEKLMADAQAYDPNDKWDPRRFLEVAV